MIRRFVINFLACIGLLTGCNASVNSVNQEITAEQLALGEMVYLNNCASCHGKDLEGQENWKEPNEDGSFRSPPHDETGHTWHHDDGYLLDRVRFGTAALPPDLQDKSSMPAYNDILSDEEITAVLTYIKNQWPDEIRQMQQERTDAVEGGN